MVSATLPTRATAWAPAATPEIASQSAIQPPASRATATVAVMSVVPYTARSAAPP
jgi:hypothetical protein